LVLNDRQFIRGNEHALRVKCSGLPAGVYYLRIAAGEQQYSGKVILR